MGMAEWTLEEAAADLRVANAKLKTLPRRMRSGRRRGGRPPPLVKFASPPGCLVSDEAPWCPRIDTHCEPCRESCVSASLARHGGLSAHLPTVSAGPLVSAPGVSCILPLPQAVSLAAISPSAPPAQHTALPQALPPLACVTMPLMPVPQPGCASSHLHLPAVGHQLWEEEPAAARFGGDVSTAPVAPIGGPVLQPAIPENALKHANLNHRGVAMNSLFPFLKVT